MAEGPGGEKRRARADVTMKMITRMLDGTVEAAPDAARWWRKLYEAVRDAKQDDSQLCRIIKASMKLLN